MSSACRRLFSYVNRSRLEEPSYLRLRNLLRFNPYLGESDPDLTQETQEFLDVVLDTDCMRIAHGYLIQWGERISFKMIGCRVKHTWNDGIMIYP